jgi:hypothetical protein
MKPMTPDELKEAARTLSLVSEIVEARADGNTDSLLGNSDDDLLGALEEAEPSLKALRADLEITDG